MRKDFNTAGPVNQPDVYKIDPLSRWNMEEIMGLIQKRKYFILHAPRQTGKTSCLLALRDKLNHEGNYFAVYVNFEVGQAWRHNIEKATDEFATELINRVKYILKSPTFYKQAVKFYKSSPSINGLNNLLEYICEYIKKPFVLFIDEIDSLIGDTLVSVLRQLRAGYDKRPECFPSTIILCGVRDIRDYRIHMSNQEIITGGSAFNIKAESLRLGNFTKENVIDLYEQHTHDTGQRFANNIFDYVMELTDGQPWLVNALAREVTWKMEKNRDPTVTITVDLLKEAKERLILSRHTHLDQLADKLEEDRVRRIVLPIILSESADPNKDDVEYCIDLGLIKRTNEGLVISNNIYKEIIPRELTQASQDNYTSIFKPIWVNQDGSLNVISLLTLLKDFWNKNSGIWVSQIKGYQEAAPQLVTQAFLQRVVNSGGRINREYGLGKKRTDLMIEWFYKSQVTNYNEQISNNKPQTTCHKIQNIVIEIKTIDKKKSYQTVKLEALEQTASYALICGVREAHILIFDRDGSQHWSADDPNEIEEYNGVKLEIWKFIDNSEL